MPSQRCMQLTESDLWRGTYDSSVEMNPQMGRAFYERVTDGLVITSTAGFNVPRCKCGPEIEQHQLQCLWPGSGAKREMPKS